MSISRSNVAIIGAGFGGLAMAHALKQLGLDDFVLFEKKHDVGGTWRENTYPGAGCDVPSALYSFSFERDYPWVWRYARQPEILDYQRHCTDKFGIRPHIQFGAALARADFDADVGLWTLLFADGRQHQARFLVTAVGQLSRPVIPSLPGRTDFAGHAFHSAEWDHSVDLTGKTVAVIGTGASAVQFVPAIAKQVQKLHVFQRTPGWTLSKVDKPVPRLWRWLEKILPLRRLERLWVWGVTESLAYAYQGGKWLEAMATLLVRWQLWRQVRDPALRARLTPNYPVGCKRILLSNEWLPTLVSPHVEVVSEAITRIQADGVQTADGQQRKVDVIIYGTGFAATDFLVPMKITGLEGRELHECWRAGGEAYLGIAVSGFPNLFLTYGPNTNLGSGSIIHMLECQANYIAQWVQQQALQGWRSVEVRADAQAAFVAEVQRRSAGTTFDGDCQSWYKTAEGRNTNNWIGSMREYAQRTKRLNADHFTVTA